MQAVMDVERVMGHEIFDVSAQKCGWGIPYALYGHLSTSRHKEVKGRTKGQTTMTVTRNEISYGLN